MKIISGDAKSLVDSVRKRIDERIDELEGSLQKEMDDRLGRAKSQAKQIRDQILQQAGRDVESIRTEKLMTAQQEAKQMILHAKGRIESTILEQVRAELLEFVKGKRKIGPVSYDDLIKKALENGRKKKIEFKITKHEDGAVLASQDRELDLRVDSLLSLLHTLPEVESENE